MPKFVRARQRPSGNEIEVDLDSLGGGGGGKFRTVYKKLIYNTPNLFNGIPFVTLSPGEWITFVYLFVEVGWSAGTGNATMKVRETGFPNQAITSRGIGIPQQGFPQGTGLSCWTQSLAMTYPNGAPIEVMAGYDSSGVMSPGSPTAGKFSIGLEIWTP